MQVLLKNQEQHLIGENVSATSHVYYLPCYVALQTTLGIDKKLVSIMPMGLSSQN
jgi:hypothetical protein